MKKNFSHFDIFFNERTGSILLLLVLVLLSACTPNKPEDIKALTEMEDLPSMAFKEFTGIATDSGRLKYRLISPEILQFDNKDESTLDFPKGLHYYTYNSNEEIESQIKCKYAVYYQKTELWELKNSVEIVNREGSVVNSEHIFWDTRNNRIYSDEFVKITTKDEIITGYGFETNEQITNFTLKRVSGEFLVEDLK